jgi:hypothetical protein
MRIQSVFFRLSVVFLTMGIAQGAYAMGPKLRKEGKKEGMINPVVEAVPPISEFPAAEGNGVVALYVDHALGISGSLSALTFNSLNAKDNMQMQNDPPSSTTVAISGRALNRTSHEAMVVEV